MSKNIGALIALALLLTGAAYFMDRTITEKERSAFDRGYAQSRSEIRTDTNRVTIYDTVKVKPGAKPKPRPDLTTPQTIAVTASAESLLQSNDSLRDIVVRALQPKTFLIPDSAGAVIAIVNYDPISDEYDGLLIRKTEEANIVTEIPPITIPCPESAKHEEEWYIHPSIFIAGGVTGALVIATGGTPLLAIGVTTIIAGAMAVY